MAWINSSYKRNNEYGYVIGYKYKERAEIGSEIYKTLDEARQAAADSLTNFDKTIKKIFKATPPKTKPVDENSTHIDDRTPEEVGERSINAFQYDNPEVRPFYKEVAGELLRDAKDTIKGERILTGNYEANNQEWSGTKRQTSESIARIKDSFNATYAEIENALNRLIHDDGQENIALAKRIELVIDDMLTEGYKDFGGNNIPPNEDYIALKDKLAGNINQTCKAAKNSGIIEVKEQRNKQITDKYITPEINLLIEKMLSIPETINNNSPERIKYREDKAGEYYHLYNAKNKSRQAYIIIGLPSAGKSTIAEPLAQQTGSMILDSDIIKTGDKKIGFEGIP